MKIALAQINTTVGNIEGNAARIIDQLDRARSAGATLVVFPELTIFGYPPKDLVLRQDLITRNQLALERIAIECTDICAVVGYVARDPSGAGTGLLNAAAFCADGTTMRALERSVRALGDRMTLHWLPGLGGGQ